jgi:cyclin-dependent kinase-like
MQNKYEILEIVGEGAFGIVMKCKNKETGELVAIKKFKDSDDEIVQKSMLRELKVLKKLKHENIVALKECFRRKGKLYLVFEYVDRNLLQVIEENSNGIDSNLLKKIIYQLCKAVSYIHANDTLHRDIKPENILITSDYNVKLCDFGFARGLPQKGGILTDYVATRWYRAPELLLASTNYGKEVDYWAIGCIIGELADGQPMFPGETELNVLSLIQKLLGNLPQNQLEMFYSNPRYQQEKLEQVSKPETLERRYFNKLSKSAILYMKSLLKLDWRERLTGSELLMHSYFDDIRLEDPEFSHLKNINNKIVIKPATRANKFSNQGLPTTVNNNGNIITNTKTNFYPNNSKSPSNEPNYNSKHVKIIPKKFQMNLEPKEQINNTNINVNFYKTSYKSFYNVNENKEDIYNFDIDTKFDENKESRNEYNYYSNNTNINNHFNKKKKSNMGNLVTIEEERVNKKMNETRHNRFKPETNDYYDEETTTKNYSSPKNITLINNNKKQIKIIKEESPENNKFFNNPNYLPQISNFRGFDDFKKIKK